jgi:rubrerythrin
MATKENLQAAFAGESQANRKYLAFAQAAQDEGLTQIAKLFRAAAQAETVHALAHLKVMGWPRKTVDNLQEAMSGENYEFTKMYPQFIEEAARENNSPAKMSFTNANRVEEIHYALYSAAMVAAQAGRDLPSHPIHVCSVCGNTIQGREVPDRCPICSSARDKFVEVT